MKTQLLSILAAGSMLMLANSTFAQNVTVDLSESGELTIKRQPGPSGREGVWISVFAGTIDVDYSPSDDYDPYGHLFSCGLNEVRSINVLSVWKVIVAVDDTLIADLNIAGATLVRVSKHYDTPPGWIVGDIAISNGLGNSIITMGDVDVLGNVDITTGHGIDVIEFFDREGPGNAVGISGNLTVNTGLDWDDCNFYETHVGGDFRLECGQSNDYVNARGMEVVGDAYLSGGQGYDSISDPVVLGELIKIGFEN